MSLPGIAVTVMMVLAILLIPIGLPGLWIMVALVGVGVWLGEVAGWVLMASVALAAVAELAEWLIVRNMNVRYGGSSRAFWGAIGGGLVGVLIGAPIPVVGSIVAGFLGSFLGAALVTYRELEDLDAARRVGWGVLLARVFGVALKVGVAVVILVLGGAAWVVR
ncbi:MAG: DUF456 family protein [Longimicrobiales bacterium]